MTPFEKNGGNCRPIGLGLCPACGSDDVYRSRVRSVLDTLAFLGMGIKSSAARAFVLAQREMEKRRSPLVHRFRPFGAGIF